MGWPLYDLLVGLAAGVSTVAGGVVAFRLRRYRSAILGFGQGAVLGVVFLDVLPESVKLASGQLALIVPLLFAVGIGAAYFGDRALRTVPGRASDHLGHTGAASLALHSLMDGLAIGFALQVSPALGAAVGAAVIAHDVADGVNTVSFSIEGGVTPRNAGRWLAVDALAPLVGILLARPFRAPEAVFATVLALLGGTLLYVGAGRAALAANHGAPNWPWIGAMWVGFGLIFAISRIA